jgi:hypothetical protein
LLGVNINTIIKTKAPIDISKEVGLEVNTAKTKCMLMSHHKNEEKNHNIKLTNRFFENEAKVIFGNDSNKSKFDS